MRVDREWNPVQSAGFFSILYSSSYAKAFRRKAQTEEEIGAGKLMLPLPLGMKQICSRTYVLPKTVLEKFEIGREMIREIKIPNEIRVGIESAQEFYDPILSFRKVKYPRNCPSFKFCIWRAYHLPCFAF
jgi:hypothetical protein